jgi:membrane-bound metal-dependent hydrolase YbcI (DUF457 family)
MPQAVTHILVPLILMALFKDWYDSRSKNKKTNKKFPLHYVLIAGLAGVLPDIDILISIFSELIGKTGFIIYATITHSIFFPIFFLVLSGAFYSTNVKARICNIGKHKLKLSTIFLAIFIGTSIHIILDMVFGSQVFLLYPFSNLNFGLDVIGSLSYSWSYVMSIVDGVLLVIWLAYLEFKHKISDFI